MVVFYNFSPWSDLHWLGVQNNLLTTYRAYLCVTSPWAVLLLSFSKGFGVGGFQGGWAGGKLLMLLKLLGIERHESICTDKDLLTHMVRQRLLPRPMRINVSMSRYVAVSVLMCMEWCTFYFSFLDFLLYPYKWNYPLSGEGQNYLLSHSILSHIQNCIKNLPLQTKTIYKWFQILPSFFWAKTEHCDWVCHCQRYNMLSFQHVLCRILP